MDNFTVLHTKMRKLALGLFTLLIIPSGCSQNSQPERTNDSTPTEEGIQMASLESAGIDSALMVSLTDAIQSGQYPNIHSLLIARDNKLVYEKYFEGNDEQWGQDLGIVTFTKDSLHDVRSISKSVVSACIGIAIAQGKIKSVDQKISEFFPEYPVIQEGEKSELTIKHLLTMSTGLRWNEDVPYNDPENSEIQMILSPDPIAFVLRQPLESPPGEVWEYNGGTTQVLAAIIEKVAGVKVDAFAGEYLFKPLGITTFFWTKYPDTDEPAAASGLRLRPRDLLKFGLLYAQQGQWNNQQILPADWVAASFQTHIDRPGCGYGYQFWTISDTIMNTPVQWVAAIGNGDQRIYFDQNQELIVVATAGNYNQWNIEKNTQALLKDFIYPAIAGK